MLNFIKYHLRRYPKYMKAWNSLQWKKHIWSDWLNTYIYKKNIQHDTLCGFKMIARNYMELKALRN